MNIRRLIPLFVPLAAWLLSQAFLLFPKLFLVAIALGVIIIIFGIRILVDQDKKRDWPLYIVAPLLFFLSFSAYAAIIVSQLAIQVIFLLVVWFLFSYLKNLYYYLSYGAPDRAAKIDYLMVSGGFLTVFAAAAVLFDLPAFINWPLAAVVLVFLPIFFLLFLQFLPFKKINLKSEGTWIAVCTLALTELAWGLALLPLNFNILALVMAIIYYLFISSTRLKWQGSLSARGLKYPLILSIFIILLLLLTANWL
ncbi:MAG: hypothetical protein WC905_02080 [Patescibacteria group bacterium]|jgi:hypothetical protein